MGKIRVLVVDDAVVIRRLLGDCLAGDAEIEVVGAAANGRIALAKIPQVNPDVVTLDVEMPEMNGLETLIEIRKTHPRLPVIMFSTLTERGAAATLDALSAGANDYVTKPSNCGSVTVAMQRVRDDLVPKIRQLTGRAIAADAPAGARRDGAGSSLAKVAPVVPLQRRPAVPRGTAPIAVAAIGVSTGGPNALAELVPQLPGDLPVPVVIVQHMPPLFTRLLAERLDERSGLHVREGAAGDVLVPGRVYLAPGGHHMTVVRNGPRVQLALNDDPPENSCRPAVDVLFRSVVATYGAGTLGVILTGMGQDGLRGCELVRDAGGQVLAQDEATSVVWGMPGFVARAGLAERILPLKSIATEITNRVRSSRGATAALRQAPMKGSGAR
ncbi:MAG: chemotaxis response regulator protein-glutamate methylesterase [Deltaproteobacteria bacterium]|nr:chemotaxis response regulator protein-glutamate methylesterase [Deltaproteobacteria bacterium]